MTHSFPTRRSCDLQGAARVQGACRVAARGDAGVVEQARARRRPHSPRPQSFSRESGSPGPQPPCSKKIDSRRGAETRRRSEEHTSELQSLMRTSYAVFCLKKKNNKTYVITEPQTTLNKTN